MDISVQIEQLQAALAAETTTTTTQKPFESVFRIDGVPILPPLLTAEKRKIMQNYKAEAIKLQEKLAEKRRMRKLTQLLDNKQNVAQPHEDMSDRLQQLQRSKTIIYDNTQQPAARTTTTTDDAQEDFIEQTQKPRHLLLKRCAAKIPDICIYPPTPQKPDCSMLDSLETDVDDDASKPMNSMIFPSDFSSDESLPHVNASFCDLEKYRQQAKLQLSEDKKQQQQQQQANNKRHNGLQNTASNAYINSPRRHSLEEDGYLKADSSAHLVRSNSFTLEGPSEALLTHMRQQHALSKFQRIPSPAASSGLMRDTIESKAKRVTKYADSSVKTRQSAGLAKSQSTTFGQHHYNNNNSNHFNNLNAPQHSSSQAQLSKVKRSPYETKLSYKSNNNTRTTQQPQRCASTSVIAKSVKSKATNGSKNSNLKGQSRASTTTAHNNNNNINNNMRLEDEQRRQFLQLLEMQQMEQQRMEAAFQSQQQMLLKQLTTAHDNPHSSRSVNTRSPTNPYAERMSGLRGSALLISPTNNAHLDTRNAYTPTNILQQSTPRRRLFANNQQPLNISPMLDVNSSLLQQQTSPNRYNSNHRGSAHPNQRRFDEQPDMERYVTAATKINAYVRGYLVRRLFQTEHIQRIVQTIRDTLIFVLNLHIETLEQPEEADSPENIKLKARLLQQLSSASHTLHMQFFETTLKERMEIIARDRKRLRSRLHFRHLHATSPRVANTARIES